jgi:glucose-6-phosphate dehydrogenase assembly protein OpcA
MSSSTAPLKPDHILHELSELWATMSKQDANAPGASGVLRACAMTLIVFVDDDSDAMVLSEAIAQLMRAHPSRAIVVRLRDDAGVLQSRVFAQCWMPFGHSQQICCEQIEFSVSLNRVNDLPSIISPLTAADVPRVVWFRASRMERVSNIGEILRLGDKIVVDSARPGAPAFADMRVLSNAGYVLGDLAWTRLTRLRELIAQLLDGRNLRDVETVRIGYSGREIPPTARYLQAWFRSQLPYASVELEQVEGARPTIRSIRIEPDIVIDAKSNCAEYETAGMKQRANMPECNETELLNEELRIMAHDWIFERALERMTPWTPLS